MSNRIALVSISQGTYLLTRENGVLTVNAQGGTGDDNIDLAVHDVNVAGIVTVSLEGGQGDDVIRITADAVKVHENATLKASIEGGGGVYTLKTDIGQNMKFDPAANIGILVQDFQ